MGARVLVGDARADRVSDADILEHVVVPHASRGHPLGRAAGSQYCLRPGLRRHCDSNFDSATQASCWSKVSEVQLFYYSRPKTIG